MTASSSTGSNLTRRSNLSCRGSFVFLGFIARHRPRHLSQPPSHGTTCEQVTPMKIATALLCAGIVCLPACSPDPRDERIARLERDLAVLREQVISNHEQLALTVTNQIAQIPKTCVDILWPHIESSSRSIEELRFVSTNTAAVVYQLATARQRETLMRAPAPQQQRRPAFPAIP